MSVFDVIRNEMFVEMSLHKEGTYMGQGGESLNKSWKYHYTRSHTHIQACVYFIHSHSSIQIVSKWKYWKDNQNANVYIGGDGMFAHLYFSSTS